MAKFKLFLLNILNEADTSSPTVSISPISVFSNEQYKWEDNAQNIFTFNNKNRGTIENKPEIGFCYSYNEELQIHQNSQKTLTFSMTNTVIRDDRVEQNPFIHYLVNGSQLLLIDKYDNNYLFTVNKIAYEFHENNIVLNYECQDSFTYQLSRQNSDYEVVNDSSLASFIGAMELDWWVLCKINQDCHIPYKYLKLTDKLTRITTNKRELIIVNDEVLILSSDEKVVSKHTIKRAFDPHNDSGYFKTIPFAASGTANSVLIELGSQYDLHLRTYEVLINNNIKKYYWFTPKKETENTGLKYTPEHTVQDFGLEHIGTSLSTILNVQATTLDDSLITLLPSIPQLFQSWFSTKDWEDSYFTSGLFSSYCQGKTSYWEWEDRVVTINPTGNSYSIYYRDGYLYITLPVTLFPRYDYIKLQTDTQRYTTIRTVAQMKSADENDYVVSFNSKYNPWEIIVTFRSSVFGQDSITKTIRTGIDPIPYDMIDSKYSVTKIQLKLPYTYQSDTQRLLLSGAFYFSQYRYPTDEEVEFATIADKIPWLENKLVNFQYFYSRNVITKKQYMDIMDMFENRLRKANARLLMYTQQYYSAMQAKTESLSIISSKIDKVGAIFQSDILDPFKETGSIRETTDIEQALSDLFASNSEKKELISYYETLADYINKYYAAEQSFLKNIYLFRQYFDEFTNFGSLYSHLFRFKQEQTDNVIYSFSNPNQYVKLSMSNYTSGIYQKEQGQYVLLDSNKVITMDNYNSSEFVYLDPVSSSFIQINEDSESAMWSPEQIYYELQWKKSDIDKEAMKTYFWDDIISDYMPIQATYKDRTFTLELQDTDMIIKCYNHYLHTTTSDTNEDNIPFFESFTTPSGSLAVGEVEEIFVPVTFDEIKKHYFYKTLTQKNTQLSEHYIHRRDSSILCPINFSSLAYWAKDFTSTGLHGSLLQLMPNVKNWDPVSLNNPANFNRLYGENFPLSTLYYYGKKITITNGSTVEDETSNYHEIPFVNIENHMTFFKRTMVSSATMQNTSLDTQDLIDTIWQNGSYCFASGSVCSQDIFGCPYHNPTSEYIYSPRLFYTASPTAYENTLQRDIFDSTSFNGQSWNGDETSIAKIKQWGYQEASNILLTFVSLSNRFDSNLDLTNTPDTNTSLNKYYYKTSYWRILTKDDFISKTDDIYVIIQPTNIKYLDLNTQNIFEEQQLSIDQNQTKAYKRLNATVFYPLQQVMHPFSTSAVHWGDGSQYRTLGSAILSLNLNGSWSTLSDNTKDILFNGTIKNKDGETSSGSLIFIKKEDYKYIDLCTEDITDSFINMASNIQWYFNNTCQPVNLITQCLDIVQDFYITTDDSKEYKEIDALSISNIQDLDDYIFYRNIGGEYVKCFTISQLVRLNKYWVRIGTDYSIDSFDSNANLFRTNVYKYVKQDSGSYKYDNTILCDIEKLHANTWQLKITENQNIKTLALTHTQSTTPLSKMSNGSFWFNYRHSTSNILMEKAMLIETNLTKYWTNAYYASKNCKYFLPEHWQPAVNQTSNYFSSNVLEAASMSVEKRSFTWPDENQSTFWYNVYEVKDSAGWGVTFKVSNFSQVKWLIGSTQLLFDANSNKYQSAEGVFFEWDLTTKKIQVTGENVSEILKNSEVVCYTTTTNTNTDLKLKNKYIPLVEKMPKQSHYLFKHESQIQPDSRNIAMLHNLFIPEEIGVLSLMEKNDVIKEMFDYLKVEDLHQWVVAKQSYANCVYKYAGGGTLWSTALQELSSGALVYPFRFGGWYDMIIWTLQSCGFINYTPVLYNAAKTEKDMIWKEIYQKYPYLILEQTYSNEDVTSSSELFSMAEYAFRDYMNIESSYNISVIDPWSLSGYKGQELKIGQGIELDASKWCGNSLTDVYNSLSQYLFITDISYNLRRDDNIQLTVNTIKYQDKVIGQLIKLIR